VTLIFGAEHQMTAPLTHLIAGLFALTLGQAALASYCAEEKTIDLSFPSDQLTELRVNALAGQLYLTPADNNVISVEAIACADKIEFLNRIDVAATTTGSVLELTVIIPYNDSDWHARYANVDVTIEVPSSIINLIQDSSGDLEARGVTISRIDDSSGDIRLRDTKGDLALSDTSGEVYLRQHDGNVTIEDSSGDLDISDVTGDLRIKRDSSGDIEIESVTGLVTIDRDSSGDIEIDQVGKSVNVAADGSGSIRIN
jgi:hypothetical protein